MADQRSVIEVDGAGLDAPCEFRAQRRQVVVVRVEQRVDEAGGFITLCEPACGAGGMVLASAEAIRVAGLNYQQVMHVTAVDVDSTACHMAYIVCTLAHIPAIIVEGNSLTLEERGHWLTPAHVLGGWDARLRRRKRAEPAPAVAGDAGVIDEPPVPADRAVQIGVSSFSVQ